MRRQFQQWLPRSPWWRHQMEAVSALLAICVVNSPHKGQWRGALMFSLICAWINGWVNNREAGDLRRNRAHYDVIIMSRCDYTLHDVKGLIVRKYATLYLKTWVVICDDVTMSQPHFHFNIDVIRHVCSVPLCYRPHDAVRFPFASLCVKPSGRLRDKSGYTTGLVVNHCWDYYSGAL